MHRSRALLAVRGSRTDRLAGIAERALRFAGDPRLGVALLLLAAAANAVAAALPAGAFILDSVPYLALLAALLLSGVASVGVRLPAAWREWRRPAPVPGGADTLTADISQPPTTGAVAAAAVVAELRRAGYRVGQHASGARWWVAGVRRGWSRFAGLGSHLALVLVVLGVAIGAAYGSETSISLLPGQQALLDAPRSGFTDSIRLERLDAVFGPDKRPSRLDTHVTFLRDGRPVQSSLLQVNRPGEFGGYLVHAWTYGPAARLRVTGLGGTPLADGPFALEEVLDGRPAAFLQLPSLGLTLGVALSDPALNRLAATLAGPSGPIDSASLEPGGTVRLGPVRVSHEGLESYVTFLSRRDPGLTVVYAGAGLLVASLAVSLWLPRRRVTVRPSATGLQLSLRGERFDRPAPELQRLAAGIGSALEPGA